MACIRRDYDEYRGQCGDCGEPELGGTSGIVDFDLISDSDLFRTRAGEAKIISKKMLLATRSIVKAMSRKGPVSEKRQMELLRLLTDEV